MPRVDLRITISVALLLLLALSAAAAPYSFGSPSATGATPPTPASSDRHAPAVTADVELARAVRELRRDRFAVRAVAIESTPTGTVSLELVLTNGRRAELLSVELTPDVGEVLAFSRAPFDGAFEQRTYPGADALLAIVADGGVLDVQSGCSSYFASAHLGGADAYLEADDYYLVRDSVRGERAGERLAAWLGGELSAGAELVSVQPNTDGAAVDFELVEAGGDKPVSVRAEIDDAGRIVAAEVRERGGWAERWQRYHGAGRLARTLRGRRAVRALQLHDASVVLTLAGGTRYVLYQQDFEAREYEGDCGC